MKKVIVIEERKKASLLEKAVRKFFTSSSFNSITAQNLIHLIQSELPDFLYIDLKQPVNEDTMMRMLCKLDEKTSLRVTLFNTGSFKFFVFNLIPFNLIKLFISSIFGRAEEKIEHNAVR
jgi:hypothetical protein